MVCVQSFIAQGTKFSELGDQFTSYNFYHKALSLLTESVHADQRRLRMIKELNEMISGSRKIMSRDLMPFHAPQM